MVRWHHQFNGHEFEQTPEGSKGQGNLECCSLWGCKESDAIEQLNNIMMAIQQRFQIRSDQSLSRVRLFATP